MRYPENEFLRRVQSLKDHLELYVGFDNPDRHNYWPFGFEHESRIEDCFKREDGLWQAKDNINKHTNDGKGTIVLFIWRIEPNYCTAGQPCYTLDKQAELFNKSETEKVLYIKDGYEYAWRWDKFLPPTQNCWGLRQGPTFFELRKGSEVLVREEKQAAFKRKVREHFKGVSQ